MYIIYINIKYVFLGLWISYYFWYNNINGKYLIRILKINF